MIDEKLRTIIASRARLADAGIAIGGVYSKLFVTTDSHQALLDRDPNADELEKRMFACYLETLHLAEALGEYEKES